jgi:aspartyl protease family protein
MLKTVLALALLVVVAAAIFGKDIANLSLRSDAARAAAPSHARQPPVAATGQGCARGEALTLHADRDGHFRTAVELEGRHVPMIIDTGATRVVLPHEEAMRLGVQLGGARKVPVATANGTVDATLVRVARLKIGPICMASVEVLVMPPGRLHVGLIGMSVIGQLTRFEMSRTRLVLAQ